MMMVSVLIFAFLFAALQLPLSQAAAATPPAGSSNSSVVGYTVSE